MRQLTITIGLITLQWIVYMLVIFHSAPFARQNQSSPLGLSSVTNVLSSLQSSVEKVTFARQRCFEVGKGREPQLMWGRRRWGCVASPCCCNKYILCAWLLSTHSTSNSWQYTVLYERLLVPYQYDPDNRFDFRWSGKMTLRLIISINKISFYKLWLSKHRRLATGRSLKPVRLYKFLLRTCTPALPGTRTVHQRFTHTADSAASIAKIGLLTDGIASS